MHVLLIISTTLDEVAWLYNIRGGDVAFSPVIHAFAVVTTHCVFLYVDENKVSTEVHAYLENNGIEVRPYTTVSSDVVLLASGQLIGSINKNVEIVETKQHNHNLIWIDPTTCCYALYTNLKTDQVVFRQSPLVLAKALKNHVELDGMRKVHIRDGAAVVQYLAWLDQQMQDSYGASGYFLEREKKHVDQTLTLKLTEVTASDKLETFRASKDNFKGLSFPTISSVGPNAAIIHYQAVSESCSELDADQIYLFDSGGQYQDGTTDITRTVHFWKPSAHEKACYTAVLKGHIALDMAIFPSGTTGYDLDILARAPLWKDGLDYRHGTGHGVGSYLNVHEGPHSISFKPQAQKVPLQASMTVTDEPGYYEDGNFGIRLKNVLIVKEADTKFNFGGKGYLSLEHITLAPYQKKMMDESLLSSHEIKWLNTYHLKCKEVLAPYMNESEMEWLNKATESIKKHIL